MTNTDKLLRAFIDAMGYEVEEAVIKVEVKTCLNGTHPPIMVDSIDYKVTKKQVMTERERRMAEQQRELMANRY